MTQTVQTRIRADKDSARVALLSAAALLGLAAAIHAAAVPARVPERLPAAVLFAALCAGQAFLAVFLVQRPRPITLLTTIWSTVGVVALYVWSRTAGLSSAPVDEGAAPSGAHGGASHVDHAVGGHGNGVPIFPGQGQTSRAASAGALDLAALGAELAVVALLVFLLPVRQRRWTGNGLLVCGLAMIVLRAAAVVN